MQIAADMPLHLGEKAEFKTFLLCLFSLNKPKDMLATSVWLEKAML
jgi:hypothetical protein